MKKLFFTLVLTFFAAACWGQVIPIVVTTAGALPVTGRVGQWALATDTGAVYIWNGGAWNLVSAGGGDMTGPAGATNQAVAIYNGATGKVLQDSGMTIAMIRGSTNLTDSGTNVQAQGGIFMAQEIVTNLATVGSIRQVQANVPLTSSPVTLGITGLSSVFQVTSDDPVPANRVLRLGNPPSASYHGMAIFLHHNDANGATVLAADANLNLRANWSSTSANDWLALMWDATAAKWLELWRVPAYDAFTTGTGVTNTANVLSLNLNPGANVTFTTNGSGSISIASSGGGGGTNSFMVFVNAAEVDGPNFADTAGGITFGVSSSNITAVLPTYLTNLQGAVTVTGVTNLNVIGGLTADNAVITNNASVLGTLSTPTQTAGDLVVTNPVTAFKAIAITADNVTVTNNVGVGTYLTLSGLTNRITDSGTTLQYNGANIGGGTGSTNQTTSGTNDTFQGNVAMQGLTADNGVVTNGLTVRGTLTATAYSLATLNVDSAATNFIANFDTANYYAITATNDVFFIQSTNRPAVATQAKAISILINPNGANRNLGFNASWKFLGSGAPTTVASGKFGLLSLTCFGGDETNVIAAYSVQP